MRVRTFAVVLLALVSVAGTTSCRWPPGGGRRTTTTTSTTSTTAGPGSSIPQPVADDCITNVRAGDHTFSCGGISYLVTVDGRCLRSACGVIVDVHGALMSGQVQREATRLHVLAPPQGYLVVHPSAPSGSWNLQTDPPKVADFLDRMVRAFHADTRRLHVTGFSMGSAMTFWFLCNKPDTVASAGPVTGSSAEQVRNTTTGGSCIESIGAGWQPRVPILFMSGREDSALRIEAARARTEGLVQRLGLSGGEQVGSDAMWSRRRWTGDGGMVLDFLEHSYTNALIAGHCIPGPAANYVACGANGSLDWGSVILQWFLEHPKP